MRTFAIGDIHGAHLALEQCLERSGFDKEKDRLILLGDHCDGWPYVMEVVEILLGCANVINIIGNHDKWFHDFLDTGVHTDALGPWHQGGEGTARSYLRARHREHEIQKKPYQYGYITTLQPTDIPVTHWRFFKSQQLYYVDEHNRCFVHGGFNRKQPIREQKNYPYFLYWDRTLWEQALCCANNKKLKTKDGFTNIFIGHTTCSRIDNMRPVYKGGVWNLDTGAGWEGKLTIMDVDTKEYWQSDIVTDLYPGIRGRK